MEGDKWSVGLICSICRDDESDMEWCHECGRCVCMDCCEWGCNVDDEDDGECFCLNCIEEAKNSEVA